MKGGNPKVRIWDDVVTYCDLESLLKYTIIDIVVFRKNGNSPYLYIFWQVRKPMVARKNDPFISLLELNGIFISSTSNYVDN